ncbi:MAG TPA: TonB-dependent receptor [Candidatus Binatia bacterium]|nr:TonB-dependent receptor [Candidatus Binatia bacterium]
MFAVVSLFLSVASGVGAEDQGAAPAASGKIAGRVIDKSTGDPIIEAGVEVIQTGKRVRTDLDGKYSFTVPSGTYELRIFAPLYTGTRLTNVVVKPGGVATADANLAPEGKAAVEVVEVVAQADKSAEATQLIQRKKSAVVSDNVAAETIAKSPDKNAAEVVKRVPGVTVNNEKFVYIRGLGERYSSALLNGSRLPSTDPSKRVVPLDLFPAEFIESISVIKSYTPDLPGDSVGLVDIRLKEFPERFTYTIGTSTGGNSNATFQDFQTYNGGAYDYFGFGKDYRSIPGSVPDLTHRTSIPGAQDRAYAAAFNNIWSPETKTAPPNFGINFSAGNTFGPLGVSLGTLYTTEYRLRRDELTEVFTGACNPPAAPGEQCPPGHVIIIRDGGGENLRFDRSTFKTRLGAVLASGYKLDSNNKFTFNALVDRNSNDEVIDGTGHDRNISVPISQSVLTYDEEQLGFGQLGGEHHFPTLDLNWHTALSQTTESQPDQRFVTYALNMPPTLFAAGEGPESGERLFSDLDEHLTDSAVDVTIPFKTGLPFTDVWSDLPAKFKFGPAYAYRHRTFDYRRFLYERNSSQGLDLSASPEVQFSPLNIPTNFEFVERSRPSDSFTATQDIAALYGMFDLPIIRDQLRLVAGVRVEYSYITTNGADVATNEPLTTHVNDLVPLPGVNLIYSLREDMNLRYGYGRAQSRPEFRELTPTRFVVPNGTRPVTGNPFLVSSDIESHDLRWEWFPSPVEVIAVSLFYKKLDKPIEATVKPESAGESDSWDNAKDADLKGFEFEARKNLGVLSPHLSPVNFRTNVSYIDSTAHLSRGTLEVQTNTSRALQGQPDYVVNAGIEYVHPTWGSAQLLYNTVGSKIVAAGSDGLPDITEEPRNVLDLVLLSTINPFGTPLNAKFAVENLLDEAVVQKQGDFTTHDYKTGLKFTFALSYTY